MEEASLAETRSSLTYLVAHEPAGLLTKPSLCHQLAYKMSDPASTASPNLNPAADEFVPTPAEVAPPAQPEEDLMEKLEKVTDHFHEEMFKPFNGNFRNLTLFFPDGLATFDDRERWFVHPWFWSDFVQDDPWYSTVDWRQYQQFKPLKYSSAFLTRDAYLFLTGGLTEKLLPSDRCIRARVRSEWGNRSETIGLMTPLQVGRYLHSMVMVAGKLLVIGGQRKDEGRHVFLNSCEVLAGETWQLTASLNTPRSTFSTAVHNETVYVFGGFSDCGVLSNGIEKLIPGAEAWAPVPVSIPILAGIATVFANDLFWLIGGSDGEHASDQILAFNPVTEQTTELVNEGEPVRLTIPRAKAIAFAVGGNRVFVFGGGVEEGEKFRNMKAEPLVYGHPLRVKEDWLLACPFAIK